MLNEIDKADCPFSAQGEDLVNVKFFRGTRDDIITGDEIKQQAHSARMQFKLGTAHSSKSAPISIHPSIDVAEFVAQL